MMVSKANWKYASRMEPVNRHALLATHESIVGLENEQEISG
jgi:hypothetical protein